MVQLLAITAVLLYQVPWINLRVSWRLDIARTYICNVINPVGDVPTPLPQPAAMVTAFPTQTPTILPTDIQLPSPTPETTPTQTPVPTALPEFVDLGAPAWEKQTPNNCGPATLSLYLKTHNWNGDQTNISDLLKP